METTARPQNIILTGFMGTGKSTAGRRLAEALGWKFLDTDDLIEQREGRAISRIFAEEGEPAFRRMEARVARELSELKNHVIATGGGMILAEENLRALEQAGAVILLEASADQILERVGHETHRPLLAKPDPRAEIERLLETRREAYGRVRIKISTDHKVPGAIAGEILERLGLEDEIEDNQPRICLRVELGERSYPIHIGNGWIERLGETLAPVFPPRPCVIVTNPDIGRLWAEPVLASLRRAGYKVSLCEIPEGEEQKNLAAVSMIYDQMISERHSRQSGIVALGGGVVGDIAGFAAATLLRGIAFIQLPTTLLAMVDSSVGGKTGVNHALGKNLIGAFWQPLFVGIDLQFLSTLPDEELRAGMAEVIKYGVIADAEMFKYLEENIELAMQRDPQVLMQLVRRSCEIKAEVVAGDEREAGRRAILNFGHTFGHAAESLTHYGGFRHGEAVAMGMAAAARLAMGRGLIGQVEVDRLESLLTRAGLPIQLPKFSVEDYWTAMGSDKKVRDGRIVFVLPDRLGNVEIYRDVAWEEVDRCLG